MGELAENNFPYEPLDAIRLLRLSREKDGKISGKLAHFSLSSSECPHFTTLSYVWGEKRCQNSITLNGHRFKILDALYPILEIICDDSHLSKDWWWIDSISINQAHDPSATAERSLQVQLMDRIYKQSRKTVGWLGEGRDGETAMDFLQVLLKHRDRLHSQREQKEKVLGKELEDRSKWAAVERLLQRPWWTRVWTLQEYIVARKFIFYCGKKTMDRDDIKVATYAIFLCRRIDSTLIGKRAFDSAFTRRRLYMWYKNGTPMSLVALIAYVSDCKATDPRDRIYSLLGLAADRKLADSPNYNYDVKKVYSELVRTFLETNKSLDIICFAHVFNGHAIKPALQPPLPSWVPDWRVEETGVITVMASQTAGRHIGNFRPTREIGVLATAYAASGASQSSMKAEISEDLRVLTCEGILLDHVDGIGGLKLIHSQRDGTEEDIHEEYQCVNSTSAINCSAEPAIVGKDLFYTNKSSKLLENISRCLVLDRKDRYLSHPTPYGHFHADFQAFCKAAIEEPNVVDAKFYHWFQINKSLLIQGQSLEQICQTATPLANQEHVDYLKISGEDSFQWRLREVTEWMARRLITTNEGYIGMAPCRAQKGDQICVLLGCSIPMILRKREGDSLYEVIGECYLQGFMNGEVMKEWERGSFKVEKFQLA